MLRIGARQLLNPALVLIAGIGYRFDSRLRLRPMAATIAGRMKPNRKTSLQRAASGEERLWKVWWQWGIPLALLANALTLLAEASRDANHYAAGDALDVLKLLAFAAWLRLAWRCSNNTDRPLWAGLARLAIVVGFGVGAVTI